jgi:hypothetical protein
MGFFTIFVPDGLSEAAYEKALRSGPSYVSTRRRDHRALLASAGFQRVEEIDLTPEFLVTTRAWLDGRERFRDELVKAEGQDAFEERQFDSRRQAEGIEAGLLGRALFLCA